MKLGDFCTISEACSVTTISRTGLYRLAKEHPGLFRKFGGRTVVDVKRLAAVLDVDQDQDGDQDGGTSHDNFQEHSEC